MKICIAGSGTAGLISALILKKTYPTFHIDIFYSEKHDIIGVGEGSTEHWRDFMEYVGISNKELIQECDATYKAGIYFEGWSEHSYLHAIEANYNKKYLERLFIYENLISKRVKPLDLTLSTIYNSLVNYSNNIEDPPVAQYHFDTFKLNKFLISKCKIFGINFIEDTIENIIKNDKNEILSIEGNKRYEYDFYIDCTGFKRVLLSNYDLDWEDFSKYLKVDSAITFPTPLKDDEVPMYTTAKAMDSGWLFRIPTFERFGNGYIFDSTEITKDEARKEVEALFQKDIEIKKHIKFNPGFVKQPWQKNCLAIGLSSNFIEPLEATSLGITIQQCFLLASHLGSFNQSTIKKYNSIFQDIMYNVRDFVLLHYQNAKSIKKDTNFWQKMNNIELPENLEEILQISKNRLLFDSDINKTNYELFNSDNYTLILYSLGLLNLDAIDSNYRNLPREIQDYANNNIIEINESIKSGSFISHKTTLRILRET